jgi:hypothetical protein
VNCPLIIDSFAGGAQLFSERGGPSAIACALISISRINLSSAPSARQPSIAARRKAPNSSRFITPCFSKKVIRTFMIATVALSVAAIVSACDGVIASSERFIRARKIAAPYPRLKPAEADLCLLGMSPAEAREMADDLRSAADRAEGRKGR